MTNVPLEPHYYSQVEVVHSLPHLHSEPALQEPLSQLCVLMREFLAVQDRQTELLEELVAQSHKAQRRKTFELAMWKRDHPELSELCRRAAAKLEHVQSDLLASITEEVEYNADTLLESEFGLSEFVDRFGTKFMHLNALLQILSQLGNAPDIQYQTSESPKDA